MSSTTLRAATRGSALALWQTRYVGSLLGVELDLVIVETAGDKTQKRNIPIEEMRGTGVFVKEVQTAVLEGRADIAVHSAKDLPSTTDPGLVLACVPERGDPRDALVGAPLHKLPAGGHVATGSVRRRAQLASVRPDLTFSNLRGNIDTRLAKAPSYDAIVVALAALQRLERVDPLVTHPLSVETLLPQVAQGALGIECRDDDEESVALLSAIEHRPSRLAVDAERAFLAELGSGCDLPVGAYAVVQADGQIELRGLLASMDGRIVLRAASTGTDSVALGRRIARQLLDEDGGAELLLAHRRIPE